MKPPTQIVTTVSILLFIGCASSRAESWSDNLYLNTDIGPAFIPDATSHFRDLVLPVGFVKGSGRFQSDPGIRGDLSLGYNLTKSVAIELEAGGIWNQDVHSPDNFYQIPVMLKARYQVPLGKSWNVYVGAGAGSVVGILETQFPSLQSVFVTDHASDTDVALGYEAEAGIKYAPCRHIEIGLGYKFLGVDQYEWNFRTRDFIISNVRVNDLFTHTAFLSFTWKF